MEFMGYNLNPDQETSKVLPEDLFKGTYFMGVQHGLDSNEQVVNLKEVIAIESMYVHLIDDMYEWQVRVYFKNNPRTVTLHLNHYGYDVLLLKLKNANFPVVENK